MRFPDMMEVCLLIGLKKKNVNQQNTKYVKYQYVTYQKINKIILDSNR